MVEAVTARVSVLPVVGSELLTGLSAATGVTDQLFLDSGSTLDKVGHGAGQSVFVWFRRSVCRSCMKSVISSFLGTSQFFLSDEEGELEMPLRINGGRASLQQEVDFNYCYDCPQKIEQVERVGPTVNCWDCHHVIDIICWLCKWLNIGLCELDDNYKWKSCTGTVPLYIQYPGGDSEVSGSPCLQNQEETTGSVDRKGQYDDANWFKDNPNRAGGTVVARNDATVAQYCSYIKGILTTDWAVSNQPTVKVSALGYPTRLVKDPDNKDTTWIRLTCVRFHNCQAGRIVMSSSKLMPVVTRPRTIEEVPSQPSESFLKHVSDSHLDKLYDLPEDIQDVMGLQALRPSAAVCKVMTIPNSKCVRIVTPDEHVSTGFHEILVHDMGQEEWPQVPLSDIGCLRLDWPKDLFAFVGRYQLELEQMRKVCRDCFGPAASGTCPTCEKYIKVNLGKHVALYHLDLAQLWRCSVAWCPVWKETSQNCVDHMRRAHNTPVTVKAGNLARWFPPWTVTREQWHSMSRPSVSGIAIDTFLFSRIGMPLFIGTEFLIVWEHTRLSGDRTCLDCSIS